MLGFADLMLDCWLEISFIRKVLRPANSIKVFRGPRANAELVPRFHIALHASHAAFPMVALETSHCTNVISKYGDLALQVGGVSDETENKAVSSVGLRPKSDCSGKAQKQLYSNLQTRPLVREGATKLQTYKCLNEISRRK
jgi:hypothetical protein